MILNLTWQSRRWLALAVVVAVLLEDFGHPDAPTLAAAPTVTGSVPWLPDFWETAAGLNSKVAGSTRVAAFGYNRRFPALPAR